MAWEDTNKDHIEILINNKDWVTAYNCLTAYIDQNGDDYWAKNFLKLVQSHLND